MSEVKIKVINNGPLKVFADKLTIEQTDGTIIEKERVTSFCMCGKSENMPYCDGAHKPKVEG